MRTNWWLGLSPNNVDWKRVSLHQSGGVLVGLAITKEIKQRLGRHQRRGSHLL